MRILSLLARIWGRGGRKSVDRTSFHDFLCDFGNLADSDSVPDPLTTPGVTKLVGEGPIPQ